MKTAEQIFLDELARHGLSGTLDEDRWVVAVGDVTARVSLENVRRDFERDGSPRPILDLVANLLRLPEPDEATWDEARGLLRYSLEPPDPDDVAADGFLWDHVDEGLRKVYVRLSADGRGLSWVGVSDLERWGVDRGDVAEFAEANMLSILAETELQLLDAGGLTLRALATDEVVFKASLLLSPALRTLVEPHLGWPVLAVAPSRDFVYLLSRAAEAELGRLGPVVLSEYREGGYPVTSDVLEISDDGISAIGSFAPADA